MSYRYFEFRAFENLVKLSQLLGENKELFQLCEKQEEIRKRQNVIRKGKICAVVAGEFKRGKSSFINALLGEEILPADVCPATAVPNRIIYGDVPRSWLRYKDGSEKEIRIEELSKYVMKSAEIRENTEDEIIEALIEYPTIPGREYLELIDTPGLNDDIYMDSRALSCMENADILILTLSPSSPFSETESRFVARILEQGKVSRIIVVVTKIDELADAEEREKLYSYLREQIVSKTEERLLETHETGEPVFSAWRSILNGLPMFGVCSPEALEAVKEKNAQLYRESGFEELSGSFFKIIQSVYEKNCIQDAIDSALRVSAEFEREQPQILECCRKKRSESEESRKCFAEECYLMVEQNTLDEIKTALWQRIETFISTVPDDMGRQFIKCLSSIRVLDSRLIDRELREQSARSEVWLNTRINKELLPELQRLLTEKTAEWYQNILSRLNCMPQLAENGMESVSELAEKLTEQPFPFSAEFTGSAFCWKSYPVPAIEKLVEPDLINEIRSAIDESIAWWSMEEKRLTEEILKKAAEQVSGEIEKIVLTLYQVKQKELDLWEETENRIKSETLTRQLRMIAEESEHLKAEFMRTAEDNKKVERN